jgi:hypothetical protein
VLDARLSRLEPGQRREDLRPVRGVPTLGEMTSVLRTWAWARRHERGGSVG